MRCFITGTDTAVGKTHFTVLLLHQWQSLGLHAAAYKPISTGNRADAEHLQQVANSGLSLPEINPIHLAPPLSPWIAARMENRPLNLAQLTHQLQSSMQPFTHVAIEGVGGWLTPLTDHETVADLARALAFPVIIVTRASLGTLNHTLLTIESIRGAGLPILGLVINHHGIPFDLASQTNPAALSELSGLPCLNLPSVEPRQPLPLPPWLLN